MIMHAVSHAPADPTRRQLMDALKGKSREQQLRLRDLYPHRTRVGGLGLPRGIELERSGGRACRKTGVLIWLQADVAARRLAAA